jgi:putative membrane protein
MQLDKKHISIFLALLFHITGVIGILYTPYAPWFIRNTPFTLCLMAVLLLWNQQEKRAGIFLFFLIAYTTGLFAEIAGVNTGLLFGHYTYGNVLGQQWKGVPLLIGVNWFIIVFCSASVMLALQARVRASIEAAGKTVPRSIETLSFILDSALLAVFFDWLMEPVAVKLGFWQWENGVIPAYNYVCWLLTAMVLLGILRMFSLTRPNHFAVHLFIIQVLFFLALRALL